MTKREQVRAELERVDEKYLDVVLRMLRSLEPAADEVESSQAWHSFVDSYFGCCSDAPIERGDQGELEDRLPWA